VEILKLQHAIKTVNPNPENGDRVAMFWRLVGEVTELALAMRKRVTLTEATTEETLKGSVEEELYDVLYYLLTIANSYDIELEDWIIPKAKLNDEKYGTDMTTLLTE
jgi:NTP pyrophosphatase (non-canonical NTP hydrolase)